MSFLLGHCCLTGESPAGSVARSASGVLIQLGTLSICQGQGHRQGGGGASAPRPIFVEGKKKHPTNKKG